jgi:hypothetical protein
VIKSGKTAQDILNILAKKWRKNWRFLGTLSTAILLKNYHNIDFEEKTPFFRRKLVGKKSPKQ